MDRFVGSREVRQQLGDEIREGGTDESRTRSDRWIQLSRLQRVMSLKVDSFLKPFRGTSSEDFDVF